MEKHNSSEKIPRGLKLGIGVKLTLVISLVLFIVFAGKAVYDAVDNYRYEIQTNTEKLTLENRMYAASLELTFAEVYQTCSDLESIVQNQMAMPASERDRNLICKTLEGLLAKNDSIESLGVFFEPDGFDGNDKQYAHKTFHGSDGRFIPYAEKTSNTIKISPVASIDDSSKNFWYTRPRNEKINLLIPPYEYESTSGSVHLLTTMALPVMKNGNVIAVINADIELTDLQGKISSLEGTSKENFKILCSRNGTIVANGIDASAIMKNELEMYPEFKEYFLQVEQGRIAERIAISATSGLDSKYILVPVKITGVNINWILLSLTSVRMFTAEARADLIQTVISYLFILIAIIIILLAMIRRMISMPLKKTSEALKDIAQGDGDLTVRLPIKGADELTDLSTYFNQTIEKIGASIKVVNSNTDIMKEIGEELSSNMTETASAVHQISANIDGVKQQALTQSASVTETAATMEEIIRTIKQLNTSIENQAASVAQSSSAVEQMVANIAS
ncbi:MAG: HAMP domain-containing protein, partial [Treponema sp.]